MTKIQQNKQQFWEAHISHQKESQQSIPAYCKEHQLNRHTFSYWQAKLTGRPKTRSRKTSKPLTAFVPAVMTTPGTTVFPKFELQGQSLSDTLPNPQWLGEVLAHMIRGLR